MQPQVHILFNRCRCERTESLKPTTRGQHGLISTPAINFTPGRSLLIITSPLQNGKSRGKRTNPPYYVAQYLAKILAQVTKQGNLCSWRNRNGNCVDIK